MAKEINLDQVLGVFTIISLILTAATYTYYLDVTYRRYKIRCGAPARPRGKSKNDGIWWSNWSFYNQYICIWFAMFSYLFLIFEIGLLIKDEYFSLVSSRIFRAFVYLFIGICTLGVSANLGLAAGSLEILVAFFLLILFVITTVKH